MSLVASRTVSLLALVRATRCIIRIQLLYVHYCASSKQSPFHPLYTCSIWLLFVPRRRTIPRGLGHLWVTRIPKNATVTNESTSQANPSSTAYVMKIIETSRAHGMAAEKTSIPKAAPPTGPENAPSSACTIPQSSTPPTAAVDAASILMSEAKLKLPKPIGKGPEKRSITGATGRMTLPVNGKLPTSGSWELQQNRLPLGVALSWQSEHCGYGTKFLHGTERVCFPVH